MKRIYGSLIALFLVSGSLIISSVDAQTLHRYAPAKKSTRVAKSRAARTRPALVRAKATTPDKVQPVSKITPVVVPAGPKAKTPPVAVVDLPTSTVVNMPAPVPVVQPAPVPVVKAEPLVALPSPLLLPNENGSLKIAVFGDTGSGEPAQYDVARMMNTYHLAFPFDTVLMVGDNIYGSNKAADMKAKFEDPYRVMYDQGIKFYASLGNHDSSNERSYELFNMKGEEYYKFEKGGVSFYALNSTYMDKRQLDWIEQKLAADTNKWKVAFFHHPPFSSAGFHGSDKKMREVLHPLFIRYSVDAVFTGHDHVYERVVPQDGVQYFVTGSGGQLRKGDLKKGSPLTARGFDSDMAFMLVEFVKDEMHFQTISRAGQTVDSGVIKRRN